MSAKDMNEKRRDFIVKKLRKVPKLRSEKGERDIPYQSPLKMLLL
jgi:hypothetical protein